LAIGKVSATPAEYDAADPMDDEKQCMCQATTPGPMTRVLSQLAQSTHRHIKRCILANPDPRLAEQSGLPSC
jgi:hypothetical protein